MHIHRTMIDIIVTSYNKSQHIANILTRLSGMPNVGNIIVVDDCSTDNSVELIESLNITNLQLFINESNMGPSYSKLYGVSKATSEYVCIIDADDDLSDDYFDTVELADVNLPRIAIDGNLRNIIRFSRFYEYLENGMHFMLVGAIIRRSLFNGIKPVDLRVSEDYPVSVQILWRRPTIKLLNSVYLYTPAKDSTWQKSTREQKLELARASYNLCAQFLPEQFAKKYRDKQFNIK